MNYFKSYTDSEGYIYSIDNVVIEYKLGIGNIKSFTKSIQDLSEKYPNNISEYWERLNCPLCSKYQYYENHIHLRDGIYIMIGKWFIFDDNKDRSLFPMIKLDVNPNKYYNDLVFLDLINLIKEDVCDYYLKRFDFALDVKTEPDNIQNFYSRKEKGLYRGTRYFGKHNNNGFCKIYDKKKESNLDYDLTRVEHTIKISEKKQKIEDIINNLSLEKIMVKIDNNENDKKLCKNAEAIKQLILRCRSAEIDVDDIVNNLEYRTRKMIFESLNGCNYKEIQYDYSLIRKLIEDIIRLYCPEKDIVEDEKGYLILKDDCIIPFD